MALVATRPGTGLRRLSGYLRMFGRPSLGLCSSAFEIGESLYRDYVCIRR
jgi:hypothetical protein